MPLIIHTPEPSEMSLDEKKAACRATIEQLISTQFSMVVRNFKQVYNIVWFSKDLTPQDVMDALGTDAAQLFQIASIMRTAANTISPNSIELLPLKPITLNKDGTVTIGE